MVGNHKVAALCTSRIYDLQVYDYILALCERLREQGFSLWIYSINEDLYWVEDHFPAEAAIFSYIDYEKTDIVILMDEKIKNHTIARRIIKDAKEHQTPVVVVDGGYEGCSDVRFDFAAGFEALMRHVMEKHKVRKPHYMGGFRDNVFSEERKQIFRKVIEEYGIAFDEEKMCSYGDFWAMPARKATEEIIASGDIPDAIICANDYMAINVCDVMKNHGYRVPEDVIITGFDGYDEAYLNQPGMTTVNCELKELAEMTAQMVEHCMEGKCREAFRVVPKLVTNESCGCPQCSYQGRASISSFNDRFYRYQDDVRLTHDCVTKMIMSGTLSEAVSNMDNRYTDHMCCVVKAECFRQERNFFTEEAWESSYNLIYDPEYSDGERLVFDRRQVMPGLEKRLESGYPLIFQGLDYMDRPMGYVVYFYDSYNITDYAKTAALTEMVNQGLGGYINMQYQQYLMSRMKEIYKIDALTGLYNRLAFREAFDAIRNNPDLDGEALLVFMADLDFLKRINDGHGHAAGDQAIEAVAKALQDACPGNALCVRFGGDEMLAFVPGGGEEDSILESIARRLDQKSRELGFRISASCGSYLTMIHRDMDIKAVIDIVDQKMYEVKKRRKQYEQEVI
ncbi:MAG: GGDEF domain-containing protein [Lachnospiraceae bacterium]|nr:GGDEF domain-containing protein [Lachnospiraceae bacterium]MBP3297789.1 GGDEF domain-containing protein [Lachnospiraceae bacterium]